MKRKVPHKEKREQKKKSSSPASHPSSFHHPLYGDVPLIVENNIRKCDPDFQPDLPPDALRGNVRKQIFCSWCHFPKYYYIDEQKQCKDCGTDFVFSAKEQKYWYEERQFNFYSTPIRCLNCRRQQRNEKALRNQLTAASNAVTNDPNDPLILTTYAETVYQYYDCFQQGNLDEAIVAARKAFKLSPALFEALFWEAACLDAAGHFRKARRKYEQFLGSTKRIHRYTPFLNIAEKRVLELEEFPNEIPING